MKVGLVLAVSLVAAGQSAQAATQASAAPLKAATSDLASLQQQLDALRADYGAKIVELEARLKAAEEASAKAAIPPTLGLTEAAPETSDASQIALLETGAASDVAAPITSPNASNPGVSVVLNGNYVAMSRNPDHARIPGFPLTSDAGLPGRGFSLGESEVTLAANVDPYLTANLTMSLGGQNEVSVEEAYIQSTALPAGLTLRAGRFYSGIGYLNERHAHNWTFIDMPLPYRAFLGRQYGDDGIQGRWLVPAPIFLEIGAELFRGDHFPAGNPDNNRAGTQAAYVHTGSDINDNSSWLAALSYIQTDAHQLDVSGDILSGSNRLGMASMVYKWAPGGNPTQRNLNLTAEYFFGRQNGTFNGLPLDRDQRGGYVQGAYQVTPRWSLGLRYATLNSPGVPHLLAGAAVDGLGRTPSTVSGLIEYDTSEFGRLRAQFSHDVSDRQPNDAFLLQYTVVYGPHGAHRY